MYNWARAYRLLLRVAHLQRVYVSGCGAGCRQFVPGTGTGKRDQETGCGVPTTARAPPSMCTHSSSQGCRCRSWPTTPGTASACCRSAGDTHGVRTPVGRARWHLTPLVMTRASRFTYRPASLEGCACSVQITQGPLRIQSADTVMPVGPSFQEGEEDMRAGGRNRLLITTL